MEHYDITCTGFFTVEEDKQILTIEIHPAVRDVEQIKGPGTWFAGDLIINADGSYVEMDIKESYGVYYSWKSRSPDEVKEVHDLVYIDSPITESTWFGLSTRTYYPSHTRYIVNRTADHVSNRKFFNNVVKLFKR